MRPIRLTLEGFRFHRDRTVLDMEGRSLVGIVGPNGREPLLDRRDRPDLVGALRAAAGKDESEPRW